MYNQGGKKNMDVKNIITHITNYNASEGNSAEYGNNVGGIEANNTETISTNVKRDISSGNFDQSKEKDEYNQKELDDALKKINNFLKDEKTHAEYSKHEDFGTLMIKIIDDETNEVILEIPPKKILDMVASMCRQVGLFDKKA